MGAADRRPCRRRAAAAAGAAGLRRRRRPVVACEDMATSDGPNSTLEFHCAGEETGTPPWLALPRRAEWNNASADGSGYGGHTLTRNRGRTGGERAGVAPGRAEGSRTAAPSKHKHTHVRTTEHATQRHKGRRTQQAARH